VAAQQAVERVTVTGPCTGDQLTVVRVVPVDAANGTPPYRRTAISATSTLRSSPSPVNHTRT
jgi:hypothetical protein